MKVLKIFLFILILLLGLLLTWIYLPISVKYRTEINSGNQFIKNLQNYQQKYGKLPQENDWKTLAQLNPLKPYKEHYPHYKPIDNKNFELIYVRGFEAPYLRYDTKRQKWEIK